MAAKNFELLFSCTSQVEIDHYLKSSSLSKKSSNNSKAGVKTYVRCSQYKKYPKCDAGGFVFYLADSG